MVAVLSFLIAFVAACKLQLLLLALFLFFLLCLYSYLKRFTLLCHFALGIIYFFLPVAGAWIVTPSLDTLTLFLALAAATQVSGSDIIYAISDIDFDRAARLHSVPAALGAERALWIAAALHASSALFIFVAATQVSFFFMLVAVAYGVAILWCYKRQKPMQVFTESTSLILFFGTLVEAAWTLLL
jgi:4-hydroxybenzoate polyprenyltransferase